MERSGNMSNCLLFKKGDVVNIIPSIYPNNSIFLANPYFYPNFNNFQLNSCSYLSPSYNTYPYGKVEIILIAILLLICLDIIFIRPLKITTNITQNSS